MTTTRLVDVLSGLRAAVIRLTVFHGLGRTLTALALGLAGAMLLDFLLRLPVIPRTMLNVAMFVSIAFVAWRFLLRPARRPPALEDIAGRIESLHPIFQDRLRSAIDFTRHPSGGSEQMQSRVINEANAIALEVPIHDLLEKKPAHRWLALGLLLTVLLVGSMAMLNPSLRSIALSRLLNPFSGANWPTRVAISPIGGLPERIAAGESVEISVTVARGDSERLSPILHIRDEKGVERQEYLNRIEGSDYSTTLSTRSSESSDDQYLDLWVTARLRDDWMRSRDISMRLRDDWTSLRYLCARLKDVWMRPRDDWTRLKLAYARKSHHRFDAEWSQWHAATDSRVLIFSHVVAMRDGSFRRFDTNHHLPLWPDNPTLLNRS